MSSAVTSELFVTESVTYKCTSVHLETSAGQEIIRCSFRLVDSGDHIPLFLKEEFSFTAPTSYGFRVGSIYRLTGELTENEV